MPASQMEQKAREFAEWAHEGQKRKYTGLPYITHPAAVAELVGLVPHTTTMICAAWLHDVVEDTNATLTDIDEEFGAEVAALVESLTDVSKPEDGNRARRKEIDRIHTAKGSPEAHTIKLADLIDNTRSIVAHDKNFAEVYLAEKRLLLPYLSDGDLLLFAIARNLSSPLNAS